MSRINIDPVSATVCCSGKENFEEVKVSCEKGKADTKIKNSGSLYIVFSSKDEKVFNATINPKKLYDNKVRNRIKSMLK